MTFVIEAFTEFVKSLETHAPHFTNGMFKVYFFWKGQFSVQQFKFQFIFVWKHC